MIEEIKDKIEERKEMIKKESAGYIQYDKGFIHAMYEVLDMLKKVDKDG